MKTIKLFASILLMIVFVYRSSAEGQKIGLYLTQQDYLNHKLSYETDGTNGTQIRLHSFFGSYEVVVIQDGKKQVFSKDKIFGYRLDGQDYRYFNHSAYRIVDTTGFYLYAYYKLDQQGKGPKQVEQFYFSPKVSGEIKQLTINNLQSAFSTDTKFVYTVKGFFKSDNELMAYDQSLKEFKLKYLYGQSVR
jgi:hypothetical protein